MIRSGSTKIWFPFSSSLLATSSCALLSSNLQIGAVGGTSLITGQSAPRDKHKSKKKVVIFQVRPGSRDVGNKDVQVDSIGVPPEETCDGNREMCTPRRGRAL